METEVKYVVVTWSSLQAFFYADVVPSSLDVTTDSVNPPVIIPTPPPSSVIIITPSPSVPAWVRPVQYLAIAVGACLAIVGSVLLGKRVRRARAQGVAVDDGAAGDIEMGLSQVVPSSVDIV
jgi:hypothetical protein